MSGALKEVRGRITSVKSTQQITKAMKLVSAAKLRRAQERIVSMRPYAEQLQTLLQNISASLSGEFELELSQEREVKNVLIVCVTSDKGLCGSFNTQVIRLTEQLVHETYADLHKSGNVTVLPIGRKGWDYMRRRDFKLDISHYELFQDLSFANAGVVAQEVQDAFIRGEYDKVEVVYGKFKNAVVQEVTQEQYLPVAKPQEDGDAQTGYITEPNAAALLETLVPKILRTQFFKYLLDSNASEHGARMTAMDKATENANDLLKDLRKKYNQARQAAITKELIEIVSGAAALEG